MKNDVEARSTSPFPPTIGETLIGNDGRERRVHMVLSLRPTDERPEMLERLYDLALAAAAKDPEAERRRADGWSVGLKVRFEIDPQDVRDFIDGKRTDLKTWIDVEDCDGQ